MSRSTSGNLFSRRGRERALYPVAVLGADDEAMPTEIVRFGGFPFARTDEGGWQLVEHNDLRGVVELDD